MTKLVFIAHPMTGDIEGGLAKVTVICREIHSAEIIPFFPSFTTRRYLTQDPADRELARQHIDFYFRRSVPDEVWLYGDRLSEGMLIEVELAMLHGIRVVAKTPETVAAMKERFPEE